MKAKYTMTVQENIFVVRRNLVDYIWKSARLEGIDVTFPDTDAIYNGITVPNMRVDDLIAINNLKHAWRFVLESIGSSIDFPFICKINEVVGGNNLNEQAGLLRNIPVSLGGTTWKPDMPIESRIIEEIAEIQRIESPTERAFTLMLHIMRRQMFLDGNKRTGMLAGNQVMIANGAGIISVPIECHVEFKTLAVEYYECNNADDLKNFIYDKCIDGIAFESSTDQ